MCTLISTTCRRAAAGLAAWLATVGVAGAGSAYLPLTGPTPLRFEVALVRSPAPNLAAPTTKPSETSADNSSANAVPVAAVPAPAIPPDEIRYSAGETNVPPPVAGQTETQTTEPSVLHELTATPQLVTPQMLAEYFRPVAAGTNGARASIFLPVQVSFTPPTDKPAPASRATYKTE